MHSEEMEVETFSGNMQIVPYDTSRLGETTQSGLVVAPARMDNLSIPGFPMATGIKQIMQPCGTTIKFTPPVGTDIVKEKGESFRTINTRYHCITVMKEYEDKSLEEWRMEDNQHNRTNFFMRGQKQLFQQPLNRQDHLNTQSKHLIAFSKTQTVGLFATNAGSTQTLSLFSETTSRAFGTVTPTRGIFDFLASRSNISGQGGIFGIPDGFRTASHTGTTNAFSPPIGTEKSMKGRVSTTVVTRMQCIACMKEYENKSLEELRLEDYIANCKGLRSSGMDGFVSRGPSISSGLVSLS